MNERDRIKNIPGEKKERKRPNKTVYIRNNNNKKKLFAYA